MADVEQEEKVKTTKKRTRNPDAWKRVKQKRARIAGKEYLNVRGNYVAPRKIGPDCQCKLMCYKQVDESMRNMIFEGFYDLKSYDEQNAYLFGLIRKHDIKRKTKPLSARRTCTYKYYLRFRGREINVLRSPDVREYFKEDKNHPTSTELNITKLYKHFLHTYDPEALLPGTNQLNSSYTPKVKMWLYRHIFHQEFKTKDYQLLKKKVEVGYRHNPDIPDYSLQDKIFTKKAKRKANKPQKKTTLPENNDSMASCSSVSYPTIVQRFHSKSDNSTAVIHLPVDVSFTPFTQDGRSAQIIDASNRNQVILDAATRNQVILDAPNRPTAMIQTVNRNQVTIEATNRNPTLNLQKINYIIQDSHGNQHAAGTQNYQIFQADTYHQNVLAQHTEHPIYHINYPQIS
ncbi:UNVERIFIED_CONTAM: hypothetical protein PYX00_005836 [Menopon gallinae]|uniref:Uncharacterized protein n=1 Tax=Menopon gallinae TaxID=328185 RepID=A0AAW2HTH1_9NEOP